MKKIIFVSLLLASQILLAQSPPKYDVSGVIISNEFHAEFNNHLPASSFHFYMDDENALMNLPAENSIPFDILKLSARKYDVSIILNPIRQSDGSLIKNREWQIGASYLKGLNFYSANSVTNSMVDTTFVSIWYNGFNMDEIDLHTGYLFKTNPEYSAGLYCGIEASVGFVTKSNMVSYYGNYWETPFVGTRGIISQNSLDIPAKHSITASASVPIGIRFDVIKNLEFHAEQDFRGSLFMFHHALTLPSFSYEAGIGLQYNF